MLGLRQTLAIGWLGPLLLMISAAGGQAPAPEAAEPLLAADEDQPAQAEEQGVQEVGPTILVVRDKDGKLHPSPDLTLETLRELEAIRQGLHAADRPPRYHFEDGKLSGIALARHAELNLELAIVAHDEQWVRVPLGLVGAVATAAQWTGPGTHFLEYDERADGHIAWIRAEGDEDARTSHSVQLKALVPLSHMAEQTRLDVRLPRANFPGVNLRVKAPNLAAMAGPTGDLIETIHQGDETEFRLAHTGGDFRLAWSAPAPATAPRPAVFEATGKIIVRFQGPSRIAWDAALTISVLQGELSTFKIKLPPAARLVPGDSPGMRMVAADDEKEEPRARASVLTVELERPLTKGATREVRLACERMLDSASPDRAVEIAGFEVLDAKQSGYIGIATDDDWQADATPGKSVMRDSQLPSGFREAGVLASDLYRYVGRPGSLLLSTVARQKKTIVAPLYLMHVDARKAALDARLRYRVLGGRAEDVYRVQLSGWTVDNVELVQSETTESLEFDPYQTQPLEIDLPRAIRGDFEVRIAAHYELPVDVTDFAIDLPLPMADEREAAIVVVQPENNVELKFLPDAAAGLTAVDIVPPVTTAAREQKPVVYQEQPSDAPARFATEMAVQTRQITAVSSCMVRLQEDSASVEQRLDYHVRYEPVRSLKLLVPAWLQTHAPLLVSLDGSPLLAEALRFIPHTSEGGADAALMEISLPKARIGKLAIVVAYQRAVSPLEPEVATAWTIDLVQPQGEDVTAGECVAEFHSIPQIRVETSDAQWSRANNLTGAAPDERLRLTAKAPARRVELITTLLPPQQSHTTVVERFWLQTWLTAAARQDRAVFQVRTNSDRAAIELPAGVAMSELVAIVDGAEVPVELGKAGPLVLSLPAKEVAGISRSAASSADRYQTRVIELWYARDRSASGRVSIDPPQLLGAPQRQAYWHVVTAGDRYAFSPPQGMASAMQWTHWWRRPQAVLTQRQLEQWAGATQQTPPIGSDGLSGPAQYLFSCVDELPRSQLVTYSALWLMVAAAGLVLGIGLALVYVRKLRHPAALLVAAVVVMVLAIRWPAGAVLLAQATLLTALVVLAAQGLERFMLWRRRWGRYAATLIREATTRRRSPLSTRSDSVVPAPSSTATAAAAVSLPSAEGS